MCGITGIINFNGAPVLEQDLRGMMKTIKHRGPDDEGVFIKDNFGIGHVRLSIIDLSSAGHMPMFSADNRYSIVFNGEIYNYIELREELSSQYTFRTRTDTEVILAAYHIWGEKCLDRFNGDFAFVIYDDLKKEFFGVRDRYGIKPFYYYKDDKQLIFASEIKAIIPLIKTRTVNEELIYEYLIYNRTDQYDTTFFKDIYKLKHGHYFKVSGSQFKTYRWYNLSEKIVNRDMDVYEYREELKSAVRLRLRSDVPVGVSLSGGIDSSSVTSVLYHDMGIHDIKSFSAVYEKGNWADESPFIDEYNMELKNMFYTYPTAETFYADFQNFIKAQGEPVASVGPYAQYKVMELAHGNVVVTLDGQGADEELAGYHYFFGGYFKELLYHLKWFRLLYESMAYVRNHKSLYAFNYMGFYMLPLSLKRKMGSKLYGSVDADFFNRFKNTSSIEENLYNPKTLNESLLQHFEYKLEHLLKWDDMNAMNFSIESRVPFLDHNLVEKTLALPPQRKIKRGMTKFILRESVKDILPQKILNRKDKKGFSTPSDEWLRSPQFQKFIWDMLNSEKFANRGYFDVADCQRKYKLHVDNQANITKDIWKWINLEVWFRTFID
jgi:asparagine synthase (glutamine-hydrolysing)